ncbi:MAG: leucine-rich repeat domain-containing protein, partial [Prevotella sp.]|nr:leucine-rich repeat domain-containing protein [Prevotella sp.]
MIKSLFTIICLLSSINASAADFEVEGICYDIMSLSEFTCRVVRKPDGDYSGDVVIPAHVNYYGKTLTVVEFHSNLFMNCTELTGITIPNTINFISASMFDNCSKLERVKFEDGKTTLKLEAKYSSNNGHYYGLFFHSPLKSLYVGRNLIAYNGFLPNVVKRVLEELTIGNSVTKIDSWFSGCSGLTSVIISNSVTEIGSSAFEGCSG